MVEENRKQNGCSDYYIGKCLECKVDCYERDDGVCPECGEKYRLINDSDFVLVRGLDGEKIELSLEGSEGIACDNCDYTEISSKDVTRLGIELIDRVVCTPEEMKEFREMIRQEKSQIPKEYR